MSKPVYILGGSQTDFARHWGRENLGLFEMMQEASTATLDSSGIPPAAVESAHIGNFIGQLTNGQGQLGGMLAAVDPAFDGLPIARHEAACASGSMAVLAAMADIESGRYDCVLVLGVEQERHIDAATSAQQMATAAWAGVETEQAKFCWPWLFAGLAEEYDRRYGLDNQWLREICRINYGNAKGNPLAQTRDWDFPEGAFCDDDEANPVVDGRLRKNDCARFTDGAAAVVLVSAEAARKAGRDPATLPRIKGWGHSTATLKLADKLANSRDAELVFPHAARAIRDAQRRAGLGGTEAIDVIETHDCFSITEYMAIDHFGLTKPGQCYRAIEDGTISRGGKTPINPGGGLMGLGHPVGATGIRMLWDAARQVSASAGNLQVDGARHAQTFNLGGSATTIASFVVGLD